MVYVVFKIIKNTNNEAGYAYPGDVFLRIVADTYINKIGKIGNETFGDGTLKIAGKGPAMSTYLTRAIISLGLYIFYRIFHYSLYTYVLWRWTDNLTPLPV